MKGLAAVALTAMVYGQSAVRLPFHCAPEDLDSIAQNCSGSEPCAVYVELTAIEPVGARILITGNLHTEGSTVASLLLASEDGGRTWSEPHDRIRTAALDQIQFVDSEVGWISGQTVQGRPRDPFLLLTTDGGKTWRRRLVFDESYPGVIDQFSFESRTLGSLIVDRGRAGEAGGRYVKCESRTGGESWNISEVNAAPLQLSRSRPVPNPDWRLRPDPAAKVFRVEHREAGKWTSLAAFTLRVGECKPPEPVFDDAPPPADDDRTEAAPVPQKKPARGAAKRKKKLL